MQLLENERRFTARDFEALCRALLRLSEASGSRYLEDVRAYLRATPAITVGGCEDFLARLFAEVSGPSDSDRGTTGTMGTAGSWDLAFAGGGSATLQQALPNSPAPSPSATAWSPLQEAGRLPPVARGARAGETIYNYVLLLRSEPPAQHRAEFLEASLALGKIYNALVSFGQISRGDPPDMVTEDQHDEHE